VAGGSAAGSGRDAAPDVPLGSFDEDMAQAVGRLLALSGTADVVDAAVVVVALGHGCAVLTSDPGDLAKLAGAAGVRVPPVVV
jgi:hypothetical protein